jgi:hypothetical protein
MPAIKAIKKYGLDIVSIKKVDLRECYVQSRPNCPFDIYFKDGNPLMTNSPHYEIAFLFYEHGERWLKNHYKELSYYKMMKKLGRAKFPIRVVSVCNSIRNGYLKGKYSNEHIVLLSKPFARTRYDRDVPNLVPEVWSGHHRIGALLALGNDVVDVMMAMDVAVGSQTTNGKIHRACVKNS